MDTEISCYNWDTKLELSNKEFGKLLTDTNYNEEFAMDTPFPSDYLLAQFSSLAYSDNPSKLPNDWILLTTAANNSERNGYFGAAFFNPMLCQIVVAHRGTKFKLEPLMSHAKLTSNCKKTNQSESATTFVHVVGMEISRMTFHIQLSITGHSLGAWLAQLSTFTLKYFKRQGNEFIANEKYFSSLHAHTVVFESPGCRDNLKFLRETFVPMYFQRSFGNFYSLDMTIYLSAINPINSINEHVGIIYTTSSKTHFLQSLLDQFDPTTERIFKEKVLHFESGLKGAFKSVVKTIIRNPNKSVIKVQANENELSLNVFNEDEHNFIRYWNYINTFQSPVIQEIRNKLPHFKTDYEYNVIESAKLNRTIASIKKLKHSDLFIYDLLESVKGIKLNEEILKINVLRFQESVVQFRENYFFKDKYRLREFLTSSKKVLNISVSSNLNFNYGLETSILNNVCKFYEYADLKMEFRKLNRYACINWNLLAPIVRNKMFHNTEYELLIMECCDLSQNDIQDIENLIAEATYKIVIISDHTFVSCTGDNSIITMNGFGHCVVFQDLQESSQQKLLTEEIISRNGKQLSILDILGNHFPLPEGAYIRVNQALTTDLIVKFIEVSTFDYIKIDSLYNHLFNGIIIELHHEIDINNTCLKNTQNYLYLLDSDESECLFNHLNIPFRKCVDFEQECFNNLDKTLYLFTEKKKNVALKAICRHDLYIERPIIHRRLVNPIIFKHLDKCLETFFICGDIKAMFKNFTKTNVLEFCTEFEARKNIRSLNWNAHILKIQDKDTVVWVESKGSIESLRDYLLPKPLKDVKNDLEPKYSFSELVQEKIVILSGDPGQGKSTIIKKMFLSLQETYWAFAIPLQHANLEDIDDRINTKCVSRFILNTCNITGDYIHNILNYCLANKTNLPIYLMFDGYDQIKTSQFRRKFIKLIKYLKYTCDANILITTQNYLAKELEDGILVPASYFDSDNLEQQTIRYLCKFWESHLQIFQSVDLQRLKIHAASLISAAKTTFGENIWKFLATPLHIRILAELTKSTSTLPQYKFDDILTPYQKLIKTRCEIYFKRCNFPNNAILKQFTVYGIFDKIYNLAIKQLIEVDIDFLDYNCIEELNKVGILQTNLHNSLYFSFLHDSVRDYVVANFIYCWMEEKIVNCIWNVDHLILECLSNLHHKEIRKFLNYSLKNCNISSKVISICRGRVGMILEENNLYKYEDTFLHICINENLHFLIKNFLMEIISEKDFAKLFCKRNSELQTPLFLTIAKLQLDEDINGTNENETILSSFLEIINRLSYEKVKSVLLATFFTYHTSEYHFNVLSKYLTSTEIDTTLDEIKLSFQQKKNFLEGCLYDAYGYVENLLQNENDEITKKYIVQLTNEFKETGLHLTTDLLILELLLEYGVDVNFQDHDGMTPLARAIKERKINRISYMLLAYGADATISDNLQNTPFSHALRKENTEILQCFIEMGKFDVDECNAGSQTFLMSACRSGNDRIVKWLLDKGAKINLVDLNNLSAFFHCVKMDQISLIELLVKKGADINIRDRNGVTPLLYSIKKNKWNIVSTLLDNGANPFITSYSGDHPLKILIKKAKKKIIQKIFRLHECVLNELHLIMEEDKVQHLTEIIKQKGL